MTVPTPDAEPQAPVRTPFAEGSPVRRWLPWAALAVVVVTCLSVATFGTLSAPTLQDRVASISRTVKCPECAGESVAESSAPASQEIRADIARRLQEGQSDDEIRSAYAAAWGQEVLLTPPASGVNLVVWVLPVVALALAVVALVVVFRRWSTESTTRASDADRALVADALRKEHGDDGAAGSTDVDPSA